MGTKEEPMKFDGDKPPIALVPPEYIIGTAKVLAFGANKYAAGNWARGGFTASRLVSAALRHILAWMGGEKTDPESGLSHIYHASCMLAFLAAQMERGTLKDDMEEIGATQRKNK